MRKISIEDARGEIGTLLEDALSDRAAFARVLDASVAHDNGFFKIVLRERRQGNWGCRIHKWPEGYADSNIHDHRWHMFAMLLSGGYTAAEYAGDEDGAPYDLYTHKSCDDNSYDMTPAGQGKLVARASRDYHAGGGYFLPAQTLHNILRVHDGGAVSAILTWDAVGVDTTRVYATKPVQAGRAVQRPLGADEVRKTLDAALAAIRGRT